MLSKTIEKSHDLRQKNRSFPFGAKKMTEKNQNKQTSRQVRKLSGNFSNTLVIVFKELLFSHSLAP